jgi:hypothetical protein
MTRAPSAPKPTSADAILIERPNVLREKIGGSLSPALIAKADHAVTALSANFEEWMSNAVDSLVESRQKLLNDPTLTAETSGFSKAALEVKSLGETYGYPLITRISHSLFRLLVRTPEGRDLPGALVDAHIDAVRALLRNRVKTADDQLGTVLATELEKQVVEATRKVL